MQYSKIDILHYDGLANTFTLQIFDTNLGQNIQLINGTMDMQLLDARGAVLGGASLSWADAETLAVDVARSVPTNYRGAIAYKLLYTDTANVQAIILQGFIKCVDIAHVPAGNTQCVQNGNNIVLQSKYGQPNNIIVHVKNGLNGAVGPAGPQGVQGPIGPQGPAANPCSIIPLLVPSGIVTIDTADTLVKPINVLINTSVNYVDVTLDVTGLDVLTQPTNFRLASGQSKIIYRDGNTLAY
jgi:hypothetical protein